MTTTAEAGHAAILDFLCPLHRVSLVFENFLFLSNNQGLVSMTKHRLTKTLVPAAVFVGLVSAPATVKAQYVTPPPHPAYALQHVTVVQADGEMDEGITILIRNGLIEAMGTDIEIPADAKVLEGDSLMVYPGFVDAQGAAEYEFPEAEIDRSQITSWAPPRAAQSFLSHRRVADHLTATGEDLADSRKKGIVAAAVHAEGRVMPGRGTVLLFRKNADVPNDLVLTPEIGPTMSFRGAQGVYPSTTFAVIAFYRQSFEDALREGIIEAEYTRDPRGITTPTWDPDHAVLREIAGGGTPVYFTANRPEEIRNVLELSQEYGFQPVIVGGGEAWRVTDELLARNVPVLVSLDFPTPERWKPETEEEADTTAAEEAEEGVAGEEQEAEVQEEEEPGPAALREKERLENLYSNPGRLAAAGVTFALTSGGGDADIREGVMKAMEYGLSEADAMRAVTTTPADMFGIPNVLRIEENMPATFVVTTGPIFDEETNIAYTFVEGAYEEGSPGGGAGSGEAPAVDMSGTWVMNVMGEMEATLELSMEPDGSLSGTFSFDMGDGQVSGSLSGNKLSMTISISAAGQSLDVEVTGTVEGDTASGDATSPMGDFSWTARRTGGPGEEEQR